MEENKKEKYINISPEPVSLEGTKNILNQMNKCVCIIYNDCEGTGFFTKIPFNNKLLPVLISNYHILNENDIKNNKKILINLNKEIRSIEIDEKRKRFTNEKLDITIVEIKEEDNIKEYIELDDNIMDYFKFNKKENPNYINKIYCNKSIYILNYQEGNDIVASYGQPPKLNDMEINHKCSTKEGSSGAPILLIKNQKLIGVHYGSSNIYELNKGTLIIYAIIEFQKIKNNLLVIDKEGKIKDNEIKNYIIGEFDIKEENKDIRIINSYEQRRKENKYIKDLGKEYENEEEIKKCEIRINDEIIPFCYYYKFNKKGKYKIKYIFQENVTKIDFMFSLCLSLTNINLSNFNTQNVTNMSCMFYGCLYLENIDLSYFSTQNVTNMSGMFCRCSSLTNINLSNFNTQNVINMSDMFSECSSLKNINLSNFNTHNVTNMTDMFNECSSLTNIDLSNFNTQNVINMSGMFIGCSSLTNIDLSDFNTQNVVNMSSMFNKCSSLTNIDLSNFNTQNVFDMNGMFYECSSLTNIDLSNFNTQNVTNMSGMFCRCSSLTNINLSNFNTQNIYDMSCMFKECYKLKKNNVIAFDKKFLSEIKFD